MNDFQNAANGLLLPEKDECAVGPWKSVLQAYCLLLLLPNDCAPGMYLHLFAKAKRAPRRERPRPVPAPWGTRLWNPGPGNSPCRGWRTPDIAFVSRDLVAVPGVGNSPPIPAVPYSWDREEPPCSCRSQFPGSGTAPWPCRAFVVRVPSPRPRPCRGYCRVNICPPPPPMSDTIKVLI